MVTLKCVQYLYVNSFECCNNSTTLKYCRKNLTNVLETVLNSTCFFKDPRETVKQIIKSKFLEVLPSDVPYKISPVIQTWSMDNGVLRLGITVTT
jgi:hypothetical protein